MHLFRDPLLLVAVLLLGNPTVLAAGIEPSPQPGLWISDSTTLINGVDIKAKLRETRQLMLANMPKQQRAMMEQMMNDAENAGHRRCITEELARQITDPEALLADAHEQMPGCEFDIEQHGVDRLTFNGSCNNKDGFTGTMQGETQMISSHEMHSIFFGEGTYHLPAQVGSALAAQLGGPIKIELQETSRWTTSDCGDTPVE